ncbi:hypothetical protein GCM10008941_12690 [Rhizomicrobium palustre]
MAAGAKLAGRQFLVAHIEQEQGLHGIDLALVPTVEFVLDHVEQLTMQALNKVEGFEIVLCLLACAINRGRR